MIAAGTCISPLWGAVPRFGVDQQNSRKIYDSLEDTGYPFQKIWEADLGGLVESQPIVCDSRIYVQAGDRLVKLDMEGTVTAVSPLLSESPMPSGSSPTYAYSVYGDRIYQATRDHRVWALDPDTLQPLWDEGYKTLSAGGNPGSLYRITSSPLAVNVGSRSYIALGTADGDQTGRPGQYADNGFFILEDTGRDCHVVYCRQAAGEVTGSPLLAGDVVVATQNILTGAEDEENLMICYDMLAEGELSATPRTPRGIPGSPAAERDRMYAADRQGRLYCYNISEKGNYTLLWETAPGGAGANYNLNSPAIGGQYVYLPIRQYQGGGGLLVAYEKSTGSIANTLAFDSLLCSNVVYWEPLGSGKEFLLVYEASGRTCLLDAGTLTQVSGFMDEEGKIVREIMLPHAPSGVKAPEPIIGENYMLLVDGAGVLHAYLGRGGELEDETDLAVVELTVPETVAVGETGEWEASIRNLTGEEVEEAVIEWKEDGSLIHREVRDFGPWETIRARCPWRGAGKPGMVMAEVSVWPPDTVLDVDESNNTRRAYIRVTAPPGKADCASVKESGDWSVTYAVLAGYRTRSRLRCSMNSGIRVCRTEYYTDYSSPIFRYVSVGYTESLSVSLTVSTGQGRLPDPARPAPEDQDGRGAWEIIPYARGKGLDPDLVTRAGAGFTLKVETTYSTDWERKVPSGAHAIGGSYGGPGKVSAEFYDTRGRLVKTVALERTEGTAGPGKAVWQLPEAKHTYQDGSTASKRWYYTETGVPDGEYQVLVRVEGAGLHNLHTCKRAAVRIYGSIYDDIYGKLAK
ncbi:MAG: PQQ-like beta-propeller repeat protein [Clostridiales bacterium]|nr:PQQ-like beta-propeller repeat protein [Clostridiales bacterium]